MAIFQAWTYFYPRPPRGGRQENPAEWIFRAKFLSTPSARRATNSRKVVRRPLFISIHALREEGDFGPIPDAHAFRDISIHALREEGDVMPGDVLYLAQNNFYPRPPRGGRLDGRCNSRTCQVFLSTPSARRATKSEREIRRILKISIHALREEGDAVRRRVGAEHRNFYPRPPRGGRPRCIPQTRPDTANFYPRPPRGGRPARYCAGASASNISIHALREEGDASALTQRTRPAYFYPRPPRGGRPILCCRFWRR